MIRRLVDSYRSKARDPVEVCRQCLQKQKEVEHFNAFITVTNELAENQALESHRKFQTFSARPLEGVPIAVKDNYSTHGIRTTCASRMLDNYTPQFSATAVKRLLNAGAVLIGKTNMDEFAMGTGSVDSFYGPIRSPWSSDESAKSRDSKDWLVTGGSSGGSGAAVASGVVFGALGSDTGGSTRSPGTMLNIVGYKPSYGLFSRHGLIPLVNSMDCVSLLAATPEDCGTLAQALLTPCEDEYYDDSTLIHYDRNDVLFNKNDNIDISKLRIGFPKEYLTNYTSSEVLDAWQIAADEFCESKLMEVSLPYTQYGISVYSVLCAAEVASNMARYDGLRYGYRPVEEEKSKQFSSDELMAYGRAAALGSVVRSRILAGNYFLLRENYEKYVRRAMKIRRLVHENFAKAFENVDILMTPLLPITPESATYDWFTQNDNRTRVEEIDVFTMSANLAGIPAVAVPTAMKNGWPRGIQLMAPLGKDRLLLKVADWLYQRFYQKPGSNLPSKYSPF